MGMLPSGPMKLALTGVPGWLGSRLVEIVLDGYGDERAPALPQVDELALLVEPRNEAPVRRPEGSRVVRGDIRDASAVRELVEGADVVFHGAAIIHAGFRGLDTLHDINTGGTRTILDAAIDAGVKRFVYVSSNSAAGANTRLGRPFREGDTDNPYLAYGNSKARSEQLVLEATRAGRIEGSIVRPCWYYGPWQADRQTRFFGMIAKGNPVLFGSGKNLRSLTYVDHLTAAMFACATVDQAVGQTYWIADERPYETLEIYQAIADVLQVPKLRPRKIPSIVSNLCGMADHVLQRMGLYWTEVHVAGEMCEDIACNIDHARREIGYEPWVSLTEGMTRSVAWCRERGYHIGP